VAFGIFGRGSGGLALLLGALRLRAGRTHIHDVVVNIGLKPNATSCPRRLRFYEGASSWEYFRRCRKHWAKAQCYAPRFHRFALSREFILHGGAVKDCFCGFALEMVDQGRRIVGDVSSFPPFTMKLRRMGHPGFLFAVGRLRSKAILRFAQDDKLITRSDDAATYSYLELLSYR
jgi:hypothetical protein